MPENRLDLHVLPSITLSLQDGPLSFIPLSSHHLAYHYGRFRLGFLFCL